MDEFLKGKRKPSPELQENLIKDMQSQIESGKSIDVNSPLYRFLMGQSEENQRKVEQIKRDIEMAAERESDLDPEIAERLRQEREGDPAQSERFKALRKMVLERKYPGYKE